MSKEKSRLNSNSRVSEDKISTGLSGLAGEYFVAGELSRRGFLASIMLRNTKGIDILATNSNATATVAIQVKTNQNGQKSWILNRKCEEFAEPNFFYVLVNLNAKSGVPEFHIVPSLEVSKFIKADHQKWLKTPGKKGQKRNDTTMRKFHDHSDSYLSKWDLLGLETK